MLTGCVLRTGLAGSSLAALLLTASCSVLDDRVATRPAPPGAKTGGTVTVAIGEPVSVDPGDAENPGGMLIASVICEPLLTLDPVTGEPEPGIVQSWATSNNNVTLRLRRGVRFHDGRELTARDVAFSLSRVARQDYASPLADRLSGVVGYEQLHDPGEVDVDETDLSRQQLSGVQAFSPTGLSISLTEPDPEFLRLLASPLASPVSMAATEDDPEGSAAEPVCAGPYRLERPYVRGQEVIRAVRFDRYYDGSAGYTRGGAGYPDTIEFRVYPDRGAETAAFAAGDVDLAHVSPRDMTAIRDTWGSQYRTSPAPTIEYLGISTSQPALQDPDVRVALSQAIDRQRLVQEVFQGGRAPATAFVPATVADLDASRACAANIPPAGDVSEALATLGPRIEALRGLPVTLYFNDDFRNRAVAEHVAGQWRAVLGLNVDLVPLEWEAYLSRGQSPGGFGGIFRLSWSSPYGGIGGFLAPLFESGRNDNLTRYSSESFDRLLEKARDENDDGEWQARYRAVANHLCDDMPMIPLTFGQDEYLVDSERIGSARDAFFDRTTGQPVLRELFVRTVAGGPPNPTSTPPEGGES